MTYNWTSDTTGYLATFHVNLPSNSAVYTSSYIMQRESPMPALREMPIWFGDVSSANVIVVGEPGSYILAGATTAFRSLTFFRAVMNNRRIVAIEMCQPDIHPGEEPEKSVILQGADWRELLCKYADITAKNMGVDKIDSQKNLTGYCTWYYYYANVTEQNLLENIDALSRNRSKYAAEYVQIDDGYQTHHGDWLDQRDAWPTPIREAAQKIIAGGMKAGIWIMPTTASTASNVFRQHPDWFVKDTTGKPVLLPGWSPAPDNEWGCIDATNPEAREYITHVFRTFRSWGFTYFKMDGLYMGLQQGVHKDPDATAVSAYRLLLKTIRDAVPDSILLACTAPFMASLGLVDNFRVSCDTSRYFRNPPLKENAPNDQCCCTITDAFHATVTNFWMIDRWFRADPDVVMARQDNAFYTRSEAKISVLGAIITGVALTSDNLNTIDDDRLNLLAKAQNIRMHNPRPMKSIPGIWPMEIEGTINGKPAVAVINDSLETKSWKLSELSLSEKCIDLLEDKEISHFITLMPGDAALLIDN